MTRRGVVFVVNAEIVGGAERHAAALARGLAARGFATDVFALRRAGESSRGIRDLRAHVRARQAGLVVAVNERPALLAALGGLRGQARVVGVLHSTVPRNGFERLVRVAHLPALYALDRLIFVSERQRAYWRRAGLLKTSQTIRNGVDVRLFAPDARRAERRAALGFAETDVVAAFCAALRPEKNLAQFLEALAALRAQGAPLKALVIGDGPCGPALRAQGQEGVVWAGMQADVRPWLAAADFGVNCSVAIETLSLSALEAMAMGLPMAMSDIGGAAEIVDARNGVLFAAGDLEALVWAMRGLLDGTRRREAGLAARARAVAEFDEETMFDRYAETFSRWL